MTDKTEPTTEALRLRPAAPDLVGECRMVGGHTHAFTGPHRFNQAAALDVAGAIAEVVALPTWDKRSVPGGMHVKRADVIRIIARLAREGSDD